MHDNTGTMSGDLEAGLSRSRRSGSSPKDSAELNEQDIFAEFDIDDPILLDETPSKHIKFPRIRETYSSNKVIAFLQKVIDGPKYPYDEPPQIRNPLLTPFEQFPQIFRHRYRKSTRVGILIVYLFLWFLLIRGLLYPQFVHGPTRADSDEPIISLNCQGNGYFWKGKNQQCGLNGEGCTPFKDREVIIRCPALCDKGWIFSATPVGEEMVKHRQYSIGGGQHEDGEILTFPYRGDSFPCSSAVHGGAVSPFYGGCVRLSFEGSQLKFESKRGPYDTGFSVGFPSFFPSSFVFKSLPKGVSGCYDPRIFVFLANVVLGAPVLYLASGLVSYWIVCLVGYWTIVLSLDPPLVTNAADPESVAELFSLGFARMLPLCFVLYTMWVSSIKRTFAEPTSPLSKLFFWYPLFWAGVANNITFDRLPIDRLTPHDIKEQSGALLTVIVIFSILAVCIVVQGYQIWRSGRFMLYFKLYFGLIVLLTAFAMLPNLQLRVHHYILGMMLIPGTSTKGLSAFVLQGVLVGLLLSGIARWDFASIVETNVSLLRGEAGAAPKPPVNFTFTDGYLTWANDPTDDTRLEEEGDLTGYSLILNDIEVYIGEKSTINVEELIDSDHKLRSVIRESMTEAEEDMPLYFRVGRSSLKPESKDRGDYTRAGVLKWPGGEWKPPAEGVS